MARRTRTVAAFAAAVAAFLGLALPAGAADQKADTVTAFVAPGSKTDAKGGFYAFDAAPGSSTTQTVVVRNDRARAIVAHVESVDAYTGASTGANYDPPGTEPSKTGTWVVVATPEVTLQPGEQRRVDFTVHVPADAKPGVYLAGISASVPQAPTAATTTANQKGAAFKVTLEAQRLIAVQITVPGPASPKLVVTGARATATPDGVALLIGIANRGNAFARGSGSIKVADTNLEQRFTVNTFVPGTAIEYRVPWTKDVVPGNHAVSVLLRYGNGRQSAWNGSVAINQTTQAKLQSDLAKNRLPSDHGLPVTLLAGAAVAVLACLAGVLVLRRRRRPPVVAATATVN
jgi:WxL interacting protein linking bacterial and host surfaces